MISFTPARRRAEEFADLVDGHHRSADEARDAELLELVGAMRGVEAPAPRPEFVTSLREQLLIEAETALSETGRKLVIETHPVRRRDRRLAVLAGSLVVVGATSSVAVASQGALPGDALYPIKRAIEGAQTSLTINDAAKADAYLRNANGRLDEVEQLAGRLDSSKASALPGTLRDFTSDAQDAARLTYAAYEEDGDPGPMMELRDFASSAMERLSGLESLLPSNSMEALNEAVIALLAIDSRVSSTCVECEGELLDLPIRLLKNLSAVQAPPAQAAPSTDPTTEPSPSPSAEPTDDGQSHQAVGPDVIDVDELERLLNSAVPSTSAEPRQSNRERAERAAKDLRDALKSGGEALLGEEGLLGPVLSPLDPVLDAVLGPLVGENGLLRP